MNGGFSGLSNSKIESNKPEGPQENFQGEIQERAPVGM